MDKRINFMVILLIFFVLVTACGEENAKRNTEFSRYTDTQNEEQPSIQEWHAFLNVQGIWELSLKETEEEKISQILANNQEEFVNQPYAEELFPQELVSRLEEVLYAYCKFGEERSDQPYQELLKELGAGNFRMTEEEIRETFTSKLPDQAFTFQLSNGKRLYLKSRYSDGDLEHYLWSKSGDEWVLEGNFTTRFTEGEVICYEDTYYYIGLERDREIDKQENDSIQLIRLREEMEWDDKLSIRYIPGGYKRIPFFSIEEIEEGAADYIEGLDTASILSKYKDFCGAAEEIVLREETEAAEYSRTDMTNTGIPIYMKKAYGMDYTYNRSYLEVDFYLYDEEAHQFLLLDNWNDSYTGKSWWEYLWCEKIGGKVYTFQLFRLEDYVYIFEVLLLEGNQAKTLQKEVWVPQREIGFRKG